MSVSNDRSPVLGGSLTELLSFVAAAFVLSYVAVAEPQLLLVGLVVTAVGVGIVMSLLKIEWAWCIFFLALCSTGVQTTVAGLTVRPEYFTAPLFLAALYAHVRRNPDAQAALPVNAGIYIGAFGFVTVGLASSFVFAPDAAASARMAVQLVVALMTIVPLLAVKLDVRFLILSGTIILSAVSTASIGFFLVDMTRRLSGLAFEYNVMGCLCVGWVGVLYYFADARAADGRPIVSRNVMTAAVPIVVALILTSTRAAWLALGFVFLYWAVQNFTRHRVTVMSSVLGCVVGLAALQEIYERVGDQDSFLWRLVHIVDIENGTGAYRVQLWNDAVTQMLTREWAAVLGTGFNSFPQFNPIDPTNVSAAYLSSMWLALVYDTGFVGTAFFAILVVSLFLSVRNRGRAVPLFVALGICTAVTSVVWFAFPWVFMALVVNGTDRHGPAADLETRRRLKHRRRRRRRAAVAR